MSLTFGTGPFAGSGSAGRASVNLPDRVVYAEPWPRRLRAVLGGETLLDTRDAVAVAVTGRLLVHWIPLADVRRDLIEPVGAEGRYRVRVGDRVAEGEVRTYSPRPGDPELPDHVSFAGVTVDRWFEEDEPVYAHLRDPYHRVDVRASSRHVVVRYGGQVVAETTRPRLLFETGSPTRYYVPFADLRLELLERSDTVSECPYKGDGQHWHLTVGGTRVEDAAWSLPHPLPEGFAAAEHVCFYPDKVETVVDGERVTA